MTVLKVTYTLLCGNHTDYSISFGYFSFSLPKLYTDIKISMLNFLKGYLPAFVVNISIILMKFLQNRLDSGVEFREAIIQSGVRRLRPIVITTITTLIGLIPTIYGIGGVDTFVQPLALVLGWGLFVATVLSLSVLPAIISFFPMLDWKRWRMK